MERPARLERIRGQWPWAMSVIFSNYQACCALELMMSCLMKADLEIVSVLACSSQYLTIQGGMSTVMAVRLGFAVTFIA